ncbi:uncharacterized protein [Coffea arabica]|uniref:Uncharacterized protein n=1 Tax=Coffea arabica TaxID=13443 RepID=A0ABM4WNC9_COFAR
MALEMESDHKDDHPSKSLVQSSADTNFRWPVRRRLSFRRRRLPTIRLGGKKKNVKPRRGFFLARLFRNRSEKLRSLKHRCFCMFKSFESYCRSMVKEMIEAGGTMDSLQHRMICDSPFAAPVI